MFTKNLIRSILKTRTLVLIVRVFYLFGGHFMDPLKQTNSRIKHYRSYAIDKAVSAFREDFDAGYFGVDCVKIAKFINDNFSRYNIRFQSTDELDPGVFAKSMYIKELNCYYISINKAQLIDCETNRMKYPYTISSDCIINFTLAHEFGHIYLEHAHTPESHKSEDILFEENMEADEFAGRLLMPELTIKKCRFDELDQTAKLFNVSRSALIRRLKELKMDTHLETNSFRACQTCGNSSIKPDDRYCSICGAFNNHQNSVLSIEYHDKYWMDINGQLFTCPNCGFDGFDKHDRRCPHCSQPLYNWCLNRSCPEGVIMDTTARYCHRCGSSTSLKSSDALVPWQPVQHALFKLEDVVEGLCKTEKSKGISVTQWIMFVQYLELRGDLNAALLMHSQAFLNRAPLVILFKKEYDKNRFVYGKSHYDNLLSLYNHYFNDNIQVITALSFEEFLPVQFRGGL